MPNIQIIDNKPLYLRDDIKPLTFFLIKDPNQCWRPAFRGVDDRIYYFGEPENYKFPPTITYDCIAGDVTVREVKPLPVGFVINIVGNGNFN